MKKERNHFKNDWKQQYMDIFKKMYPMLTDDEISSVLDATIKRRLKDTPCVVDNNYKDAYAKTTLLGIYNFYKNNKPIMAGNGMLFKNQDKVTSPIETEIKLKRKERDSFKEKMKKAGKEHGIDSYEYIYNELQNKSRKQDVNAIYGSFGTKSFALYNPYVAGSVTITSQSVISTTAMAFENFLSNNVKFENLGECMFCLNNITNEEYKMFDDEIKKINDIDIVFERISKNFKVWKQQYTQPIYTFLRNCNETELTYLYYKNNIYEYVSNEKILNIIRNVFDKVEVLSNPNKIPEVIKQDLEQLWMYVKDYVFYNYSYINRISRLDNDIRDTTILIDTDSNVINIHPWVMFMKDKVWKNDRTKENNVYTSVNILAYLITCMISEVINKYADSCNVLERYKSILEMKNEYLFSKIFLSLVKKRYSSLTLLREGDKYEKLDIKGHDFIKAGITESTKEKLSSMLFEHILKPDDINIKGLLKDLDDFENEIKQSLLNGDMTYLLRANAKGVGAYKDPYSMYQVTSVIAWNAICPDNPIDPPENVYIALTNIKDEKDLDKIKDSYPDVYDALLNKVLGGTIKKLITSIEFIAIPTNLNKIPSFIIPFIDYDRIIARNLNTFKSVREALGLPNVVGSKTDKREYFSNILDI